MGRMYIEQAPYVPLRPSSPYANMAQQFLGNALMSLRAYVDGNGIYDQEQLVPEAQRLLDKAQVRLQREIGRNMFLAKGEES